VAESFVALNPSPELWERYLDRIAQRRDRDEITEELIKALVFSTETKRGLVEATRGDLNRVDDQAIGEVLARYGERVPSGFVQKLESTFERDAYCRAPASRTQKSKSSPFDDERP
jgi:hypothetical protein